MPVKLWQMIVRFWFFLSYLITTIHLWLIMKVWKYEFWGQELTEGRFLIFFFLYLTFTVKCLNLTFKVNFKEHLNFSEQILNFRLNSLGKRFLIASIKKNLFLSKIYSQLTFVIKTSTQLKNSLTKL